MDKKLRSKFEEAVGFADDLETKVEIAGETVQEVEDAACDAQSQILAAEEPLSEFRRDLEKLHDRVAEDMVLAEAVGVLEDAKARIGVVADQLADHDDAEVRDEMESLRQGEREVEAWLNEHYYEGDNR